MKAHTVYRTFRTDERRGFVRITDDVQRAVDGAGIAEGMVLVSAMHITAGVWTLAGDPLLRVRRAARQAADHQGPGRAGEEAGRLSLRCLRAARAR